MAILRVKEINAMTKQEKEKKIQELRFELIKSRASASKGGNAKIKMIKRTIAQIITLNK